MIYGVLFLKSSASHLVSTMNKHSGMVPRKWNLNKGRWFRKMCKTNGVNRPTAVRIISLYGLCLSGRLKVISSTGQT
jgi:hypothetical protein